MSDRITAEYIRLFRRENGISQLRLAERVGISQAAVSKWESGKSQPSLASQRELRDAFTDLIATDNCGSKEN